MWRSLAARSPHRPPKALANRSRRPERALDEAERSLTKSKRTEKLLDEQVVALRDEIGRVRAELIAVASRTQDIEGRLNRLEPRLESLQAERQEKRTAYLGQREEQLRMLGALQRVSRSPPEALMLMPASVSDISRVSLLLVNASRLLDQQARVVREELADLSRLEGEIGAQHELIANEAQELTFEQSRLKELLDRKAELLAATEVQWRSTRSLVDRLARDAKSLQELLSKLQIARVAAAEASGKTPEGATEATTRQTRAAAGTSPPATGAGQGDALPLALTPEISGSMSLTDLAPTPRSVSAARGNLNLPARGPDCGAFRPTNRPRHTKQGNLNPNARFSSDYRAI